MKHARNAGFIVPGVAKIEVLNIAACLLRNMRQTHQQQSLFQAKPRQHPPALWLS